MYKHYVRLTNTFTSYTQETFVVLDEVDETLAEIVCEEKFCCYSYGECYKVEELNK